MFEGDGDLEEIAERVTQAAKTAVGKNEKPLFTGGSTAVSDTPATVPSAICSGKERFPPISEQAATFLENCAGMGDKKHP